MQQSPCSLIQGIIQERSVRSSGWFKVCSQLLLFFEASYGTTIIDFHAQTWFFSFTTNHSLVVVWIVGFRSIFTCSSLKCFFLRFKDMSLSSVNSLGISDELKQKLQDVMVDRHKLTLGKTLGEGKGSLSALVLVFSCSLDNEASVFHSVSSLLYD